MFSHSSRSNKKVFLESAFAFVLALSLLISPLQAIAQDAPPSDTPPASDPAPSSDPAPVSDPAPSSDPAPTDSTVTTGDAVSTTDVTNEENTNITDTSSSPEASTTTEGGDASSTPDQNVPQNTTVTNTNDASTTNEVSVGASSGDNTASNNSGSGSVQTGIAAAAANVLNVVNVNIFNSNGFLMLLNNLFGNLGTIDLRDLATLFGGGALDSTSCSCGPLTTTVSNDNVATISNSVVVRANSGGNSASGNGGDGMVTTGDAYAAANVVNVANTNITNSNYMMLVLNNLGSWNGNFVLPNASFFSQFLMGNGGVSGNTTVSNDNTATVNNTIGTSADTGGNSASSTGESVIQTGNAAAGTNVVNQVNQNLFGGSSVILLFRIFGNWTGSVFNTPPGILWEQTPFGVQLMQDPNYGNAGSGNAPCNCADSSTTVTNTNSANVSNNVEVYALTGANQVNGNGGASTVSTGNAYAAANVVNMVNNNIYGRNWILAIVNIFGDWNGSISFGEPDLWIGTSASVPSDSSVSRGGELTYHFTVANRGDADAHHVRLYGGFDNPYLTFNDATSSGMWFDIGTVKAGETREITSGATVNDSLPIGYTALKLSSNLFQDEPDHNPTDNSDNIIVAGSFNIGGANGPSVDYTPDPEIVVTKTNDAPARITASTTVNYTIKVKNNGGPAYDAELQDELRNDAGTLINSNYWDLDTVKPGEEITVTYTLNFNQTTPPGVYVNTAHIEALGRNPSVNPLYGIVYESPAASSTVVVLPANDNFAGITTGGSDTRGGTGDTSPVPPTIPTGPKMPKIPTYENSELNRFPAMPFPGGNNDLGSGSGLREEIMKYLPLVFSADSLKPLSLKDKNLLAGLGFALPHVGSLDLLLLLILILFLILNRLSFKEIEARLKNRFASFL